MTTIILFVYREKLTNVGFFGWGKKTWGDMKEKLVEKVM